MSEQEPLVSIVLPTLNGSQYIATSIASCLRQTYERLEIIVVDGGSTDNTLDIVRAYADRRIRVVAQPNNTGRLPGALNCGFAEAKGELFSWTQDDDYYAPEALATMVQALQTEPEIGFVYAGFWFVDGAGQTLHPAELGAPDKLRQQNVVGHCFLYRRAVAERVGEYDPAFLMAEDFHYWVRVYRVAQMRYLPGRYYFHRLHDTSLTMRDYGRFAALRVGARARQQVLRIPWTDYQRQMADAYIQEAFAAHAEAAAARVRRCVCLGVLHNPAWLRNRGVLSIAARAWLGPQKVPAL